MFKICQKLVESKYIVFFIEEIYLKALVKNAYFFLYPSKQLHAQSH